MKSSNFCRHCGGSIHWTPTDHNDRFSGRWHHNWMLRGLLCHLILWLELTTPEPQGEHRSLSPAAKGTDYVEGAAEKLNHGPLSVELKDLLGPQQGYYLMEHVIRAYRIGKNDLARDLGKGSSWNPIA